MFWLTSQQSPKLSFLVSNALSRHLGIDQLLKIIFPLHKSLWLRPGLLFWKKVPGLFGEMEEKYTRNFGTVVPPLFPQKMFWNSVPPYSSRKKALTWTIAFVLYELQSEALEFVQMAIATFSQKNSGASWLQHQCWGKCSENVQEYGWGVKAP